MQDCLHFGDFYVHFTTRQKKRKNLHDLPFSIMEDFTNGTQLDFKKILATKTCIIFLHEMDKGI
jgi:hypothetical protein